MRVRVRLERLQVSDTRVHCAQVLCRELMTRLDDDLKHELLECAADYEHRMQRGAKDIFHFEAFIAKFMTLYKKFLLELYM